jgi:hypothetical protein
VNLAQNKLSWDTVKLAVAILKSGLVDTGLDDEQKSVIAKEVSKLGSLTVCIKDLEHKQKIMTEKVGKLEQQENYLSDLIKEQKSIKNELSSHLLKETKHRSELDAEIKVKSEGLAVLREVVSEYGRDLYAAWLVLAFLSNPKLLSNYDFDKFVQFIVGIRQYRLGVGPRVVTGANGNVVCQ